ncbi:DUF5681 domain-containing protein [Ruegeria aquimaris]|uniref:DUF5681 domain-containing protein n=1 Tax=Ruegeria aquimaris TaxID=2984333 RepID=A0ABT3ANG9_9RHOB|nr:DUF5681 domain-containing protein [Ruegeria sp. XHP0148]MCV2890232.1 DUF5681 domain-containing protein [Ruegeria sp. XHP0148]
MSKSPKDYEVGYGKPPKASQFKKGYSGNPKGRPKEGKNVGTMLEDVFFRKIAITEHGKRREVPMLEAILRQLVNGAVKGELRSVDRVLKLLPMVQEARAAAMSEDADAAEMNSETGVAVLEALAEMFGGAPDQLFATVQKGLGDDRAET